VFFKETFTTLNKLYVEGGIEIRTLSSDEEQSDLPEEARPVLIRTLIQPDADVLMSVDKEAISQPGIWDAHQEKLAQNIKAIRNLRRLFNGLWQAIRVMGISFLLFSGYEAYEGQITLAALGLGLSIGSFLLKPLSGFLIQQYLKRKANFS